MINQFLPVSKLFRRDYLVRKADAFTFIAMKHAPSAFVPLLR